RCSTCRAPTSRAATARPTSMRWCGTDMSFLRHILVWILSAAFAVGPAAPYAFAGPVVSKPPGGGNSVVQTSPTTWDVNVHNGAIIQYSSFNVLADAAVRF